MSQIPIGWLMKFQRCLKTSPSLSNRSWWGRCCTSHWDIAMSPHIQNPIPTWGPARWKTLRGVLGHGLSRWTSSLCFVCKKHPKSREFLTHQSLEICKGESWAFTGPPWWDSLPLQGDMACLGGHEVGLSSGMEEGNGRVGSIFLALCHMALWYTCHKFLRCCCMKITTKFSASQCRGGWLITKKDLIVSKSASFWGRGSRNVSK